MKCCSSMFWNVPFLKQSFQVHCRKHQIQWTPKGFRVEVIHEKRQFRSQKKINVQSVWRSYRAWLDWLVLCTALLEELKMYIEKSEWDIEVKKLNWPVERVAIEPYAENNWSDGLVHRNAPGSQMNGDCEAVNLKGISKKLTNVKRRFLKDARKCFMPAEIVTENRLM